METQLFSPSSYREPSSFGADLSYLKYSTKSWCGSSFTGSYAIQIQQNKAFRAFFLLLNNHPTHDYFKAHSIMTIEEIYKMNISFILFDCSKRRNNCFTSPKFNRNVESHNHTTRHGSKLHVTRFIGSKSKMNWCIGK